MAAVTGTASVGDALQAATDSLRAAGVDTPELDAAILLEVATGWDRSRFISDPAAELPAGAGREFAAAVRRRVRREPVAYIVGRKGFRRIELDVDPRVLIPRPETELLVEIAIEARPAAVIDVGTGSGAVALAVADELPGAAVTATDTSESALEVARANAERLGLADRVRFEPGSVPRGAIPERVDLLLANLPYVSEADWDGLAPEIREFEPREALVSGSTGLEAIEALLVEAAELPGKPARIALEVGEGQAEAVEALVERAGYRRIERRRDIAAIERVVTGRR
jgi:release factor glutamine methyltransferase